jgi:hypothetical protein
MDPILASLSYGPAISRPSLTLYFNMKVKRKAR